MVTYSACEEESLSKKQVKGKIVYCLGSNGQDSTISENRGAGVIMSGDDNYSDEVAFSFLIPATVVNQKDGKKIEKYINSTRFVIPFITCTHMHSSLFLNTQK